MDFLIQNNLHDQTIDDNDAQGFHLNITTSFQNITTTAASSVVPNHDGYNKSLVFGISIPIGIIFVSIVIIIVFACYKWQKRKSQLERELTPFYAYDQSEAEVVDGILYASDSSNVDMFCVVGDSNYNSQDHDGYDVASPVSSLNGDNSYLIQPVRRDSARPMRSLDSISV